MQRDRHRDGKIRPDGGMSSEYINQIPWVGEQVLWQVWQEEQVLEVKKEPLVLGVAKVQPVQWSRGVGYPEVQALVPAAGSLWLQIEREDAVWCGVQLHTHQFVVWELVYQEWAGHPLARKPVLVEVCFSSWALEVVPHQDLPPAVERERQDGLPQFWRLTAVGLGGSGPTR